MDIPWCNWGVGMDSQAMRHLMEDGCPYCSYGHLDRSTKFENEWWNNYIVGFSNSEDIFRVHGEDQGAIAVECPNCFHVSWRHVLPRTMSDFAFFVEKGVYKFLVPGAHEAFMAAYEQAKKEVV